MPIASHKVAAGLHPTQIQLDGSTAIPLTANNTTQGTATLCTNEYNEFATVALNGAAILPTTYQARGLVPGDEVWTVNNGANPLIVFPQVGGYIGAGAQNASVSVAVNTYTIFVWTAAGKWMSK